ncbi:hypothetical protein H8356DRAFT_1654215 [Neocallimastix lanati (nom. inval.)]|uniref:M-phase phosphoprotein 6 n=1 Tax=Neocallimastix californiae TaxID=1754190 RepID=A0A1Y2AY68_9FUNG|nr:hypothetical protein H8356DRAFT_1654215 [Neocallimastix sp. JGI-2020a]ORY27543.1 hypothetical protein LY90DRAFT_705887 [Neocallimastix californiae]|eukprot:ORY27543.1 hypothetical protein LY90DRAFT_705887 [Neocallimastix californiae]
MSSHRQLHVKELSGNILKMKFMQRNREQQQKEEEEKEQQRALSEAHWVLNFDDIASENETKIESESSFMNFLEGGNIGRRSYQKFNNTIEKLAEEQMKEQKIKKIEENETTNSVSDKEMLDRYKKDIGALPTNKSEKHNLVDEEGVKESSNKKQKLSSKKSKVTSKDFIKPE